MNIEEFKIKNSPAMPRPAVVTTAVCGLALTCKIKMVAANLPSLRHENFELFCK